MELIIFIILLLNILFLNSCKMETKITKNTKIIDIIKYIIDKKEISPSLIY